MPRLEDAGPKGRSTLLRIEKVDESNFKDIPSPCKYCLYWQTGASFSEDMPKPEMELEKREWFNKVIKEFGSCMKIAYLNGVPIGFIQYAQAKFFPNAEEYTSGPPSNDAVFIACHYIIDKETRGKGHGTAMFKDLIIELKRRGFKAVETFGRKSSGDNPSGPSKFYMKQGFKIVTEKDDFPLLRLEL